MVDALIRVQKHSTTAVEVYKGERANPGPWLIQLLWKWSFGGLRMIQ